MKNLEFLLDVKDAIKLIGEGMRLVVPRDGKEATLIEGLRSRKRPNIQIPVELARQLIACPNLYKMKKTSTKHRGGWGEFYSGPPADIYCLVM
jgi:hypothetical protein